MLLLQVLLNQKNEPLLVASNANNTAADPRVVLKFPPGSSSVPLRYAAASSRHCCLHAMCRLLAWLTPLLDSHAHLQGAEGDGEF